MFIIKNTFLAPIFYWLANKKRLTALRRRFLALRKWCTVSPTDWWHYEGDFWYCENGCCYCENGGRYHPLVAGIAKEVFGTAKVMDDTTNEIRMFFIDFGLYSLLNVSIDKEKKGFKGLFVGIYLKNKNNSV